MTENNFQTISKIKIWISMILCSIGLLVAIPNYYKYQEVIHINFLLVKYSLLCYIIYYDIQYLIISIKKPAKYVINQNANDPNKIKTEQISPIVNSISSTTSDDETSKIIDKIMTAIDISIVYNVVIYVLSLHFTYIVKNNPYIISESKTMKFLLLLMNPEQVLRLHDEAFHTEILTNFLYNYHMVLLIYLLNVNLCHSLWAKITVVLLFSLSSLTINNLNYFQLNSVNWFYSIGVVTGLVFFILTKHSNHAYCMKLETNAQENSMKMLKLIHDLKNPIISCTYLIQEIWEDVEVVLSHNLKLIHIDLQHSMDMIDNFRQKFNTQCGFSKEVEPMSAVCTLDLVSSIKSSNKFLSISNGIIIYSDIDDDFPKIIITKPITLKRILNNFVSNSCKYSNNTNVRLKCKRYQNRQDLLQEYPSYKDKFINQNYKIKAYEYNNIYNTIDNPVLAFITIDNGAGMDKVLLNQLFENDSNFDKYHKNVKNTFESTGMGLNIVKSIYHKLNGGIIYNSIKKDGITITYFILYIANYKPISTAQKHFEYSNFKLNSDLKQKDSNTEKEKEKEKDTNQLYNILDKNSDDKKCSNIKIIDNFLTQSNIPININLNDIKIEEQKIVTKIDQVELNVKEVYNKIKIILVEDNLTILRTYQRMLQRRGVDKNSITSFEEGQTAFEYTSEYLAVNQKLLDSDPHFMPDLVLIVSDNQMPLLTGLEFAQKLKSYYQTLVKGKPRFVDYYFVILSADQLQINENINEVHEKPFNLSNFDKLIESYQRYSNKYYIELNDKKKN